MSPFTEGILAGVIANALTSVLAQAFPPRQPGDGQLESLKTLVANDLPLAQILQKAAVAVAKSQSLKDPKQTEKLRIFFISPEAETITRQVYGLFLIPEARTSSADKIKAEFSTLLALHLGEPPESLTSIGGVLFESLMEGCERALNSAIEKGILSAHEAKSAVRHRILLGELKAIHENVAANRHPGQVGYSQSPPREVQDEESSLRANSGKEGEGQAAHAAACAARQRQRQPDLSVLWSISGALLHLESTL